VAHEYEEHYGEVTRATYERATFGGTLTLGERPAVLVVDFSTGFTDPACPLGSDMSEAVEACRRVLDAARAKGVLIVYTVVAYAPHLKDASIGIQKSPALGLLQLGSKWADVDPRLAPRDDEVVVVKQFPSALFGTPVTSIFTAHRIDTVVLCGAVTSGCIRATAVDLYSHGYPTLLPSDCVADRAEGPHEASLFDLSAKYLDVVTSDEAIEYLAHVPESAYEGAA
jgi:nicotinamidase-related amidase